MVFLQNTWCMVVLKIWLKKISNRLLTLEEVPDCLKEGLVVPIYKRQGKDPLLVSSYRGNITLLCAVKGS